MTDRLHRLACTNAENTQTQTHLQTVGVDDFVADGALHEHEVELLLFILGGVLFARFPADEAHCRVRQDRLQGRQRQNETGLQQNTQTLARCTCLRVETLSG